MTGRSSKPAPLAPLFDSIPNALRACDSWVTWRYALKDGKWTKPPFQPSGRHASTKDPATWSTFAIARAAAQQFDGIGLVLVEDLANLDIVGLDLDHVINGKGEMEAWARAIFDRFAGSYVERSPSGDGLRIFCRGRPQRCGKGGPGKRLEVYDHTSPRYLTVTGHSLDELGDVIEAQSALDWLHNLHMSKVTPTFETTAALQSVSPPRSDDEVLRLARGAKNKAKFNDLWEGKHGGDDSAADAALVSMLGFWTQDVDQIDRLFRKSHLMREKWDSPRGDTTYGFLTIGKMLALPHERHSGPTAQPAIAGDGVVLVQASTLKPEPVSWLWHGWLAVGKLHVLAGSPGHGKTTIALSLAAIVTAGLEWPDGSRCPPASVLIWSGEDDASDTLLPRLIGMGADTTRIYFVQGTRIAGEDLSFDPARDIGQLMTRAESIGSVALLIVDPIVSAVTGDSHKNGEVRRALQPLVDLGAKLKAAVLGISHFTKNSSGRDPTERVTGSLAFGAVARVVMCAAKAKGLDGGPDRRILARSKSNIGPDDGGFEYSMSQVDLPEHSGLQANIIVWGTPVSGTARDLLTEAPSEQPGAGERSMASEAEDHLRELLKAGPLRKSDVLEAMKAEGFTEKVIRTARERMNISIKREGFGAKMFSTWGLSVDLAPATEAHSCPGEMRGATGHDCLAEGATDKSPTPIMPAKPQHSERVSGSHGEAPKGGQLIVWGDRIFGRVRPR